MTIMAATFMEKPTVPASPDRSSLGTGDHLEDVSGLYDGAVEDLVVSPSEVA